MSDQSAEIKNHYQQNYVDSLRKELVDIVETKLTPVALKYGYSSSALEDKIKWKPMVLILGNYSSGKSTLINELLEVEIQKTGQAPTDDSFTVLTYKEQPGSWDERDGMVLLNDPQFPFQHLKHHGQRFASHFRLKQVHAKILQNLAIIDTPGMLDSVSERDRGYDYQKVIAELASIADLILVLFDPHKAGTIKETYESLRKTLPAATYEDRVLFVLNRIDECENLNDLLRVYGTLCWNLSQMTGRKDIPHIFLTFSPQTQVQVSSGTEFLPLIHNQRQDLKKAIENAPKHRLDHLATFIESHGQRLRQLLEALDVYGRQRRGMAMKMFAYGSLLALLLGVVSFWLLPELGLDRPELTPIFSALVAFTILLLWFTIIQSYGLRRFHRARLKQLDHLVGLETQDRLETWQIIEPLVRTFLGRRDGKYSLRLVKKDLKELTRACEKSSRESRIALNEVSLFRNQSGN